MKLKDIDWKKIPEAIMWRIYYYIIVPILVFRLSHKKKITVLFYLSELSVWKTETLYKKMVKTPSINPIIGIVDMCGYPGSSVSLRNYCETKKYDYVLLNPKQRLYTQLNADIVIYQRPYTDLLFPQHRPLNNLLLLVIYIPYSIRNTLMSWNINQRIQLFSWLYIFENTLLAKELTVLMKNKGRNVYVTGTPVMDELINMQKNIDNVWHKDGKKRIIWAPHHTIGNMHCDGISYGNFIDIADEMLALAEKYEDSVQFAFKPHPQLYRNLLQVWGRDKTDAYYDEWQKRENCILCEGKYDALFAYSDAMIHDSGSFIIEYLYTNNPVAYIVRKENTMRCMSQITLESLKHHDLVRNIDEIDNFIQNVINGIDSKKLEREQFVVDNLLPPHGNSACDNIISTILDKNERQKFKLIH